MPLKNGSAGLAMGIRENPHCATAIPLILCRRLSGRSGGPMDSDTLQAAVRSNAMKSVLLVAVFPFVLPTVIFVFALVGLGIFGNRNAAGTT